MRAIDKHLTPVELAQNSESDSGPMMRQSDAAREGEAGMSRRAFLIKKEYDHGSLSAKDEAELESLQRLASLRRNLVAPIDRRKLDTSIRRLKRLGQWPEN